jgi:GGDEF domain-containing protein
MFQQRRMASGGGGGNVKVGHLADIPSQEDLAYVLEQAVKHRGRFAEISWSVPKSGASFQLTAKVVPGQPQPAWMLYGGPASGAAQLVWGHNSNDLTLIHNLVMLECDKPMDGSNSISASSVDSMAVKAGSGKVSAQSTSGPQNQWLANLQEATQPPGDAPRTVAGSPQAAMTAAAMETSAGVATMTPPVMNPGDLLDGSLANIGVADLFHYLANNKLTGRLAIASGANAGEVFFQNGQMKHAATLETKGENALFDMATWTDGAFQFHAEQQSGQVTVAGEPAEIIQGCRLVLNYFRALLQQGLNPASYLVRTQELDLNAFDRATRNGLQLDAKVQYRLFEEATGDRTITEILRMAPMVRAEWIPIVYNLLQTGVLQISDRPVAARPGMYLEGEPLNTNSIGAFVSHITQPNGLFASGAFLYVLQQEFFRHQRTGSSFSLMFFSIAQTNLLDGNVVALDQPAWVDAMRRIHAAKRNLDVLGQFDQTNCAIMLPETDTAGAAVFANRVIDMMKKPALAGTSDTMQLVFSFGIASCPDDARDLETLVAAVRVAKNKSRMMGAPVILYGDN